MSGKRLFNKNMTQEQFELEYRRIERKLEDNINAELKTRPIPPDPRVEKQHKLPRYNMEAFKSVSKFVESLDASRKEQVIASDTIWKRVVSTRPTATLELVE